MTEMSCRCRSLFRATLASRWLVLCLGLLVACAKTSGGHGPSTSTETGNPPVIDPNLVALVVSADKVAIVGEPGAVTPGGAEVEIEVVGSGDVYRVTAEADGSFEVVVMGSGDDVYLVRGTPAQGEDASMPVFVYRGGAQVGGPKDAPLSCSVRDGVIEAVLDAARAGLDRSCMLDSDCVAPPRLEGCYYAGWSCGGEPVSQLGRRQLQSSVDALNRSVCDGYEAQGCFDDKALPRCPVQGPIVCNAGRCEPCAGEDCEAAPGGDLTCEARDLAIEGAVDEWLTPIEGECMTDSECMLAPSLGDCFHSRWLCSAPVVSRTRAEQMAIALDTLAERSICDGYLDAGCWDNKPMPDCRPEPTPVCEGSICMACFEGQCDPASPAADSCSPHVVAYPSEVVCLTDKTKFHWDGSRCFGHSDCGCFGPDCGRGVDTLEECEATHRACQSKICGGFAGSTCDMGEYCAYVPEQACGFSDASATCQPIPDACDANYDPVCGCDNKTYSNACTAASASMGILRVGECP